MKSIFCAFWLGAVCLLLPASSFAQLTYTTVANGNWSSASTWPGGSVPPTSSNIPSTSTISIRHIVTYNTGNPIKLDGMIRIEPITGTTARLDVSTGISTEIFSAGRLLIYNGSFTQYRFSPGDDGQPYSGNTAGAIKLSGSIKNIGGRIEALNAYVETAQDFVNESGGTRILVNSCVKTGQNFSVSGSTSTDTLLGTNISLG